MSAPEPPLPRPAPSESLSPQNTWMRSRGTPSRSLTICVNAVSLPWPIDVEPVKTATEPSALTRISAVSGLTEVYGPPATSIGLAMPRPRSLPRVRASARRFSKPAWSASDERHVHAAGEVAAVVGEDEPGLERHRRGRDQVASGAARSGRSRARARRRRSPARSRTSPPGGPRRDTARSAWCSLNTPVVWHVDGRRRVDAGDAADVVGARPRAARREVGADVEADRHAQREELAVARRAPAPRSRRCRGRARR